LIRRFHHISLSFFLILFSGYGNVFCQDKDSTALTRFDEIEKHLRGLIEEIPALEAQVDISVTDVSVQEFLRAVANSSGLNLDIDPALNFNVVNNFNQVKVIDVLLFLVKHYQLEIYNIGNILHIYKVPEIKEIPPTVILSYDLERDYLSLEINDELLSSVAREITKTTNKNIVLSPGLEKQKVSGYIQDMSFDNALEKFAYSNNLLVNKSEDGFYLFEKVIPENIPVDTYTEQGNKSTRAVTQPGTFELYTEVYSQDSIDIHALNAPILEVVKEVSNKIGYNYIVSSALNGFTTISAKGISYDELLEYILKGSNNAFKKEGNVYFIGDKGQAELMNQKIVQLQYRTVDTVLSILPEDLITDLQIREFRELNSLLLSGPTTSIEKAENFIKEIDQLVPVLSIEVIIVDINKSFTIATGVDAGLGENDIQTSGQVFPYVDMQLNANTINSMINRFNGFGWVNIGKVSQDFYMSLQAMEDQGILNIRSTPLLSTLNGHGAQLSIGNTEYYLEEQVNIIGTQNPQTSTTQIYRPVNADLSITIMPVVSGDDQITLEIEVTQSDFTERISQYAPPGSVSRKFKSQIRVKNEEMILLGGLEEKRNSETSRGFPLLSRIPILKWIFSSRTKETSNTKLNIFIKPTIIS